jgi:hypothetical protein
VLKVWGFAWHDRWLQVSRKLLRWAALGPPSRAVHPSHASSPSSSALLVCVSVCSTRRCSGRPQCCPRACSALSRWPSLGSSLALHSLRVPRSGTSSSWACGCMGTSVPRVWCITPSPLERCSFLCQSPSTPLSTPPLPYFAQVHVGRPSVVCLETTGMMKSGGLEVVSVGPTRRRVQVWHCCQPVPVVGAVQVGLRSTHCPWRCDAVAPSTSPRCSFVCLACQMAPACLAGLGALAIQASAAPQNKQGPCPSSHDALWTTQPVVFNLFFGFCLMRGSPSGNEHAQHRSVAVPAALRPDPAEVYCPGAGEQHGHLPSQGSTGPTGCLAPMEANGAAYPAVAGSWGRLAVFAPWPRPLASPGTAIIQLPAGQIGEWGLGGAAGP